MEYQDLSISDGEERSHNFLKIVQEMFPDVDLPFLESAGELKNFETEEGRTNFITNVMLRGLYPKNIANKNAESEGNTENDECQVIFEDLSIIVYSSDEEISSSGIEGKRSGGKREKGTSCTVSDGASKSKYMKTRDLQDSQDYMNGDVGVKVSSTSSSKENNWEQSFSSETSSDIDEESTILVQNSELLEDWIAEHTADLIRLFPNTDPSFLRAECVKFKGSSAALNEFVIKKLDKNDMPSRADYEKNLEMEELQNRYTKNFSIEDFLMVIPDPWTYFRNKKRQCIKFKQHSLIFLKSKFRKIFSRDIISSLIKNEYNLYLTYKELEKRNNKQTRLRQRCDYECNVQRPTSINIQFLQEVAFIENEEKIKDFIDALKVAERIEFEEAKKLDKLLTCECCFDNEVMCKDTAFCPNDHCFCKTCIKRYVEIQIGLGKYHFSCLADCGAVYTLTTLQTVLAPELFSKVIHAIQLEEIKMAGIQDLVQCPFCSYATIMPPEVKIMSCLNPECQKETCRLCKELSHIPLRCDEVEKSEEIKMRTYIENKMTEALVRICYNCGKGFVKEEGCNKMICSCGAKMCYICRKPIKDYSHFNGQGGTDIKKCPLYSTNDELHVDLVTRIGKEAKATILQKNPKVSLKHDPTIVLPERTYDKPLPGVNQGAALALALRAARKRPTIKRKEGSSCRNGLRST